LVTVFQTSAARHVAIFVLSLGVIKTFFEQNSIRHRMLSGFLFLTALIAVVGAVSVYQFTNVKRISDVHRAINQLQVLTLKLIKADNDFFDYESTNEQYFRSGTSTYLRRRDSLRSRLAQELQRAAAESDKHQYPFNTYLKQIEQSLVAYDDQFKLLERLVFTRGFRDFGLEGEMREHAHALESPQLGIPLAEVLSLRRHEKDFLLRHDTTYISQFNTGIRNLLQLLQQQRGGSEEAVQHLLKYQAYFRERAEVERQIGLTSYAGVRHELNTLSSRLSLQYEELTKMANNLNAAIQQRAMVFYGAVTIAAVLFSILSSMWLSRRLSEPIARLSKLVNSATFDRNRVAGLKLKNAAIEVTQLTESFVSLIGQINGQLAEIESKTTLLKTQNEALNKVNHELDNFLYSAAHDLRAPLASLQGIVNLMKRDSQQPQLLPYFELIQSSIKRQQDFIIQIVSYAMNKNQGTRAELLDLRTVLNEVFQNHDYVPGAAEVKKIIHVKDEAAFYSDRARVLVIFNNLVSNSIRYSDPKKDERFVQCRIHTHSEGASIEFTDNGVGISAEHLDKIFDMFYRANYDSKGSGLGLFIFREAITKLGGFVTVESEPGVGTKFFIRLPNLSKQVTLPWADRQQYESAAPVAAS
jgi:signal transduction histidine kinase